MNKKYMTSIVLFAYRRCNVPLEAAQKETPSMKRLQLLRYTD